MFNFIKRLLGYPTEAEKAAAKAEAAAPYKVEAPIVESKPVNPQCSDSVTQPDGNECKSFPAAVNDQITDAVTQAKPAAMKAKKKPADKKTGRKPKSAKS